MDSQPPESAPKPTPESAPEKRPLTITESADDFLKKIRGDIRGAVMKAGLASVSIPAVVFAAAQGEYRQALVLGIGGAYLAMRAKQDINSAEQKFRARERRIELTSLAAEVEAKSGNE